MKPIAIISIIFLLPLTIFAQAKKKKVAVAQKKTTVAKAATKKVEVKKVEVVDDNVYNAEEVDYLPRFKNEDNYNYMNRYISCEGDAEDYSSFNTRVTFIVEKNGSISELEAYDYKSSMTIRTTLDFIQRKMSFDWEPAKINDHAVRSKVTVSIRHIVSGSGDDRTSGAGIKFNSIALGNASARNTAKDAYAGNIEEQAAPKTKSKVQQINELLESYDPADNTPPPPSSTESSSSYTRKESRSTTTKEKEKPHPHANCNSCDGNGYLTKECRLCQGRGYDLEAASTTTERNNNYNPGNAMNSNKNNAVTTYNKKTCFSCKGTGTETAVCPRKR